MIVLVVEGGPEVIWFFVFIMYEMLIFAKRGLWVFLMNVARCWWVAVFIC